MRAPTKRRPQSFNATGPVGTADSPAASPPATIAVQSCRPMRSGSTTAPRTSDSGGSGPTRRCVAPTPRRAPSRRRSPRPGRPAQCPNEGCTGTTDSGSCAPFQRRAVRSSRRSWRSGTCRAVRPESHSSIDVSLSSSILVCPSGTVSRRASARGCSQRVTGVLELPAGAVSGLKRKAQDVRDID